MVPSDEGASPGGLDTPATGMVALVGRGTVKCANTLSAL